jgi:hypothetical protein
MATFQFTKQIKATASKDIRNKQIFTGKNVMIWIKFCINVTLEG